MEDFLKELQKELEIENTTFQLDTNLKDCDEWDSMTVLSLMSFVEIKYSIVLSSKDIENITTVRSLAEKLKII